jgi:hypothetical protein
MGNEALDIFASLFRATNIGDLLCQYLHLDMSQRGHQSHGSGLGATASHVLFERKAVEPVAMLILGIALCVRIVKLPW